MIGIYKIVNIVNNKFYIGSSKNIKHRWGLHLCCLRNNTHHSKHLQSAFNKYGELSFQLELVEEVELVSLIEREQHYIDRLNPCDRNIGYNSNPNAKDASGYKRSEDSKIRSSISQKNRWKLKPQEGNRTANWGKFGKANHCSKPILQFDLDNNFIKEWASTEDAARFFKKKSPYIRGCINNRYSSAYGFIWKKKETEGSI